LALTLALNFLAAAGGVAWLFQSHHLDRLRVHAIKDLVFPPEQPPAPATQPTVSRESSASRQLEELLAKTVGKRTAAEQVQFIQERYYQSMAELDRRQSELTARELQVADASKRLLADRKALDAERQKLTEREQEADRLANDKGFQDTLTMYSKMTPSQTRAILYSRSRSSPNTWMRWMWASERTSSRGRAPDEMTRIKSILERIRKRASTG
jgi:hypothetical protein